ncbi:MAG: NYN domain-containing protein [Candidatus Odinarchaeia archaeon]
MAKSKSLRSILNKILKGKKNVGLIVDCEGLELPEVQEDLVYIKKIAQDLGKIQVAKIFLNSMPQSRNVKKLFRLGFHPNVHIVDLDLYIALETMGIIYNDKIEILLIVTANENLLPLIHKAKEHGKEVVIVKPSYRGEIDETAFINSSDLFIRLEEYKSGKLLENIPT